MRVRIILVLVLMALVGCSPVYNISREEPTCSYKCGHIEGLIIDKETGEGVIGVSVAVVGTTLGAQTDLDGRYVIKNLESKVYSLRITSIIHSTVEVTDIVVRPSITTEVNQSLEKKVSEIDKVITVHGKVDYNLDAVKGNMPNMFKNTIIQGVITDSATGEPVVGVSVVVDKTRKGAISDSNGFYLIHGLQPSTYSLKIMAIEYQTSMIEDVMVKINDTVVVNGELVKKPIQLMTPIGNMFHDSVVLDTINEIVFRRSEYRFDSKWRGTQTVYLYPLPKTHADISGTVIDKETGLPLVGEGLDSLDSTGVIQGFIIDKETGKGIYNSSAVVKETKRSTISEWLDGRYQLRHVNPGTYTIRLCALKYESLEIDNVVVKARDTTIVDGSLARSGSFGGTVIDDMTGHPVAGAIIWVGELGKGIKTGLDGRFQLPILSFDTCQLYFISGLHETIPDTQYVDPDEDYRMKMIMKRHRSAEMVKTDTTNDGANYLFAWPNSPSYSLDHQARVDQLTAVVGHVSDHDSWKLPVDIRARIESTGISTSLDTFATYSITQIPDRSFTLTLTDKEGRVWESRPQLVPRGVVSILNWSLCGYSRPMKPCYQDSVKDE